MSYARIGSVVAALAILAPAASFAQDRDERFGPLSAFEAGQMSVMWPEIRGETDFDDIDWAAYGLSEAPGGWEARGLIEHYWDALREAERFEHIDWTVTTGYDAQSRGFSDDDRDRRAEFRDDSGQGPFTRREAERLSEVWSRIRVASRYEDIDWDAMGLRNAPGDERAEAYMARHWGSLRVAERFDDIDWADPN
jgi:hypothetical protein